MKKLTTLLTIALLSLMAVHGQQSSRENLEKHVTYLASDEMLGRGFGSEQGKIAADYIIRTFESSGVVPLLDTYRHSFVHRRSTLNIFGNNIVGLIEGSDPELKDEYIILGGHYDHVGWEISDGDTVVYNGADDNASGVAAVLELGRILSEHRDRLGRSVVLMAFDGEESGLIGSKRFVQDSMMDFSKVKAMFSLDMVGMYEAHEGVDLIGIDLIKGADDLLEAANARVPLDIRKASNNLGYRTDTKPFGEKGIPAVHVFTGTESPYHKPEDDSDLLDYEGMKLITDFMAALVMEMSVAGEITPASKIEKMGREEGMKRFNPGVTFHIGSTFHDYPDQFFKAKPVFAGAAGLSFETRLAQWLAVQPEVMYEWAGSQNAAGNFRTHSVLVPVSFLLTTPDPQNNGFRNYFQVGGYYSYSFAGTLGGNDLDFTADFSDSEFGLVIGVGLEIMNFRIGYVSYSSFVNRYQDESLGNLRTNGNFAKIGWVF